MQGHICCPPARHAWRRQRAGNAGRQAGRKEGDERWALLKVQGQLFVAAKGGVMREGWVLGGTDKARRRAPSDIGPLGASVEAAACHAGKPHHNVLTEKNGSRGDKCSAAPKIENAAEHILRYNPNEGLQGSWEVPKRLAAGGENLGLWMSWRSLGGAASAVR